MPVAWLAVFAVIAAALFKLAFVDGLEPERVSAAPEAALMTPTVAVGLGTVTNVVQLQGSVVSDKPVTVRSTAEGKVNHIFVTEGSAVAVGDPLFQVRQPVEITTPPVTAAVPAPSAPAGETGDGGAGAAAEVPAALPVTARLQPAEPRYTYANVVATAAGTVGTLSVLPDQQVTVGMDAAAIDPGTFSVTGSLTPDEQFRLLGRPSSASVTVTGGPAPFDCGAVEVGEAPSAGEPAAGAGTGVVPSFAPAAFGPAVPDAGAAATGTVTCTVPAEVPVFAGLSATIDIAAGEAADVLTVPTTAVKGSVGTGIVWVMGDGGAPQERNVTLGLNDGASVEIVDGVSAGEQILQFVPGSPAPDQNGPMGPMGPMGPGVVMGG
jgi:hypothetical protein